MRSSSERFHEKTFAFGDCLIWDGAETWAGYGKFWDGEREVRAHRFAWQLAFGPIPDGLCVCHTCDNRLCVKPGHLFLGTRADNLADMRAKGREARGQTHGRRKLDLTQVEEISERREAGEPRASVARAYGVCVETISHITNRKTWK